jgi:DNA-binding NtrC family response regulator
VRIAESGSRALQIYKDGHVDLVLSDVVMPGMDGFALLLQLQAIDPQVHLMMMTGQTNVPQVEHMLKAGAIGPIVKPFTIDELLDTISHQIPDLMSAPN